MTRFVKADSIVVSITDPKTGESRVITPMTKISYILYRCSGCDKDLPESDFHGFSTPGRKRPVASRCRACRKEAYYSSRYEKTCACCMKHRPLQSNGVCRTCNEESAVRECRHCARVLPLFLSFFGRSCICKDCRKESK